jgi:hypothetical protein
MQGSRYKFIEMFGRVCDLDVVESLPHDGGDYDFAIVRGDKSTDYRRALAANLPYILIEHDVWSVRAGLPSDPQEREMIEKASSVLFTSKHHVDLAQRYSVPPSEYVYLRPLRKDLEFTPLPKLSGRNIVYAGGIVGNDGSEMFGYRKYAVEIFPALIKAGWTVHVYPAWNGANRAKDYRAIGCVIHDPVPQADLYREMSQYQAAFQGYAEEGCQQYVASCRPNKLWEGLGAGIPILGYNPGTGAHIYSGKWGVVARSLADIPAVSERVLALRITNGMRFAEVIDHDIPAFERLVSHVPERVRPIRKRRLGVSVTFGDTTYRKGSYVPQDVAVAMYEAGLLHNDPARSV